MEIGPTERAVRFVVEGSLADVPLGAVDGAKWLAIDTIGVGLAALAQPVARALIAYAREFGSSGISTIVGEQAGVSAPTAAWANGCVFNLLDYDGFWHVATYTLAASLAVGELVDASGSDVLEAFLLASEVASRLRDSLDGKREEQTGPTYRGWYHVSIYGPIAAALAASKLLGLDVDQARAAVGIAANSSGGFRQNLGTTCKSMLSGNSASAGVSAATLAQRGISGDPHILEARVGLAAALCLPGECDWTPLLSELGQPYALAQQLDLKTFPSVGPTQPVIAALQRLVAEHGLHVGNVTKVEARLSGFSAGLAYPTECLEAGFSWPYVLGATLVDGQFSVKHLSEASLGNREIKRAAALIDFEQPEAYHASEHVAVTLTDGRRVSMEIDPQQGWARQPEQIEQKFRDCARLRLSAQGVDKLLELVMRWAELDEISELTAALR